MKRCLELALAVVTLCSACVAPRQDAPRRQSLFGSITAPAEKTEAQQQGALPSLPADLAGQQPSMQPGLQRPGAMSPERAAASRLPAQLFGGRELVHVDGNVWRSSMDPATLFSMLSRILSQSYLLTSADRKNLTLNTDWDKFFIDGRLFRNRLSVSVFPIGSRQTEVVVKNSVEYFAGNPNKPEEMMVASWLPTPDITDEVTRIVDSINKQIAYYQSGQRLR